jgi:hypothetical protein
MNRLEYWKEIVIQVRVRQNILWVRAISVGWVLPTQSPALTSMSVHTYPAGKFKESLGISENCSFS